MKHFANCSPEEFMTQAVKFRGPFVDWVNEIGIVEIRKRRPEGFEDMSDKEKVKAVREMATENMGEILANALEVDPDGTKAVMCLATFTAPEDFNRHTMVEYLSAIFEMLGNSEVTGFFTYYIAPKLRTFSKG